MGTFLGHAVPGTFFFCFSLWWTWCIFHRYFIYKRRSGELFRKGRRITANRSSGFHYRNIFTFSATRTCSRYPLEGIIKIVAVVLGMTGEFASAFENGHFKHLHNAQHMTMFFFFGLNGVIDVMHHYEIPLPPDIDYASGILALAMEALLFFFHLHGRHPMDVQVHMLLFYVIVSSAVATAFEMRYKNNVLPALCRVYFIMLQGTWFYQIGFVLYPPFGSKWDPHNHDQMMIVTLLFTWHNAAIFAFLFIAGTVIYFRVKTGTYYFSAEPVYPVTSGELERVPSTKMDLEMTRGILVESEDEET